MSIQDYSMLADWSNEKMTAPFVLQVHIFLIQVRQLKSKLGKIIVSTVQEQRTEVQVQPKYSSSTSPFPD